MIDEDLPPDVFCVPSVWVHDHLCTCDGCLNGEIPLGFFEVTEIADAAE